MENQSKSEPGQLQMRYRTQKVRAREGHDITAQAVTSALILKMTELSLRLACNGLPADTHTLTQKHTHNVLPRVQPTTDFHRLGIQTRGWTVQQAS